MYSCVVRNRLTVISFSLSRFSLFSLSPSLSLSLSLSLSTHFLYPLCLLSLSLSLLTLFLCRAVFRYPMLRSLNLIVAVFFARPCNAMLFSAMLFLPGYIVCYTMSSLTGGGPLLWHAVPLLSRGFQSPGFPGRLRETLHPGQLRNRFVEDVSSESLSGIPSASVSFYHNSTPFSKLFGEKGIRRQDACAGSWQGPSRFEVGAVFRSIFFWPSDSLLAAAAGRVSNNWCVWTSGVWPFSPY